MRQYETLPNQLPQSDCYRTAVSIPADREYEIGVAYVHPLKWKTKRTGTIPKGARFIVKLGLEQEFFPDLHSAIQYHVEITHYTGTIIKVLESHTVKLTGSYKPLGFVKWNAQLSL